MIKGFFYFIAVLGLFFLAAGVFGLRFVPAMEAAIERGAQSTSQVSGAAP
jgi:hypothetical protein